MDIDELLQFLVADAEFPVRRETLRVRDRHVRECLPDHGDAIPADFLDDGRLEHAPRGRIERLGVVERGFLGEENVLRQEFALEAFEVGAQRLLAIGEFPMAGHRLDAEQVGGIDHVGALQRVGKPGALPEIAAVEQQRAPAAGFAAHPVDQRLQMRKAAELAESSGGLLELDAGEGIGVGAVGADAEAIEEGASDQMRRVAPHRSDAEIDARLAKKHRPKLRMGIGDVQDARIAEALEIVDARIIVGGLRASRGRLPDRVAAPASVRKSRRRMVMRVSARRKASSIVHCWSMILAENRFPLFRIML